MANIHADLNVPSSGEAFEELLRSKNVHIERIISSERPGQKEYNQDHDEWVLLLNGSAALVINDEEIRLAEGDYLFIPKNTPHRVMRTEAGTVWLAVHIG